MIRRKPVIEQPAAPSKRRRLTAHQLKKVARAPQQQQQLHQLQQPAQTQAAHRQSDESVWIYGLINNIEQLLSSFNAQISQQQASNKSSSCAESSSSSGHSTPSSLSPPSASAYCSSASCSPSASSSCTPAAPPQQQQQQQELSAGQQQAHVNQQQQQQQPSQCKQQAGNVLVRSPISRQIKFHEYKGPPQARRPAPAAASAASGVASKPTAAHSCNQAGARRASEPVGVATAAARRGAQRAPIRSWQHAGATLAPAADQQRQRQQPSTLTSGSAHKPTTEARAEPHQLAQPAQLDATHVGAPILRSPQGASLAAPTSANNNNNNNNNNNGHVINLGSHAGVPQATQFHCHGARFQATAAAAAAGHADLLAPDVLGRPLLACHSSGQCAQTQLQLQLQPEYYIETNQISEGTSEFYGNPNGGGYIEQCDELEPTIGFGPSAFEPNGANYDESLLFSEFIDFQDIPLNVDESDWLKKFLPPCSQN